MRPPRIERFGGMRVVGLRRRMTMADHRIPEVWKSFRAQLGRIRHRAESDFVNLRVYDALGGRSPGLATPFDQWAAVEVDHAAQAPHDLEALEVPPGSYAVFVYEGPAAGFASAARWFYGSWLPSSGWVLDDRPHFEVLPEDYVPTDPKAREEVWIPVRAPDREES